PNRTVKRLCADDSAATSVKVGHRQAVTPENPRRRKARGFSLWGDVFMSFTGSDIGCVQMPSVLPSGAACQNRMAERPSQGETTVKNQNGLTIIELMIVLLVAGVAGSFALNAIIDHRCERDPAASICTEKPAKAARPSVPP
ncbi:MAG: prepilin-type N-terminal cleavage/methylation domain-containing protein, partial [Noviherbaspirillum sp.]